MQVYLGVKNDLINYYRQRAVSRAMRAVSGGWHSQNLLMTEVSKDKNK